MLEASQVVLTAYNRRLSFLRNTVLFSALAAEAYANEFLSEILSTASAHAVDRLRTPDKLLLGPALAGLVSPLTRGQEPHQELVRISNVRNKLVHPRLSGPSAYAHNVNDDDHADIGPTSAANALYAVAVAITLLDPLTSGPHIIGPAPLIAGWRVTLDAYVAILGDEILALPDKDAPAPVHLLEQMRVAASSV